MPKTESEESSSDQDLVKVIVMNLQIFFHRLVRRSMHSWFHQVKMVNTVLRFVSQILSLCELSERVFYEI